MTDTEFYSIFNSNVAQMTTTLRDVKQRVSLLPESQFKRDLIYGDQGEWGQEPDPHTSLPGLAGIETQVNQIMSKNYKDYINYPSLFQKQYLMIMEALRRIDQKVAAVSQISTIVPPPPVPTPLKFTPLTPEGGGGQAVVDSMSGSTRNLLLVAAAGAAVIGAYMIFKGRK